MAHFTHLQHTRHTRFELEGGPHRGQRCRQQGAYGTRGRVP
jgi:hypothetical protein